MSPDPVQGGRGAEGRAVEARWRRELVTMCTSGEQGTESEGGQGRTRVRFCQVWMPCGGPGGSGMLVKCFKVGNPRGVKATDPAPGVDVQTPCLPYCPC